MPPGLEEEGLPQHTEPPSSSSVEAAKPPATEGGELPAAEPLSLPAPPSSQAPPRALPTTNPWAEARPTPPVPVEGGKEASVAPPPPPQPLPECSCIHTTPAVVAAPATEEQEQAPLPLAPPPDEMTTTTTTTTTHPVSDASIAMDDATEQLMGLGFVETEVRRALRECGGDAMQAADYLLLVAAAGEGRGGVEGGGMESDSGAAAAAAAAVVDSALAPPPNSRQARVMEAVQQLVQQTRGEPEAGILALTTLQSMLQTLLDHPQEPKYKRVRLGNAKFQRALGRFPPAMELLRAVGFEEQGGGQGLEYTRNDPGLLWWGKSAVEGAQEQVGKG